jgi:hypothetical protein
MKFYFFVFRSRLRSFRNAVAPEMQATSTSTRKRLFVSREPNAVLVNSRSFEEEEEEEICN